MLWRFWSLWAFLLLAEKDVITRMEPQKGGICQTLWTLQLLDLQQGPVRRIDEVYRSVDYSAPLLPPFLTFSDEMEPLMPMPGQNYKSFGMR